MLSATPPMGWNSWYGFGDQVNEGIVKATVDALVASGVRDVGYEYVVVDDGWAAARDDVGRLTADAHKFPAGMAALAEYVHERGLRFGLYSDAAERTCAGYVGSAGHEADDAGTFAAWGVDYLKYDYCGAALDRASAVRLYTAMGEALRATGRPIVYSICEWGGRRPWLWGAAAGGQLWRTGGDIGDSWDDVWIDGARWSGIERVGFEWQRGLEEYAGPGHWNDPDLLLAGLRGGHPYRFVGPGCSDTEYRTQFSLWCLLAAPLMASCDLRSIDEPTRRILANAELIALDQDPLGRQGYRVSQVGHGEVFVKPLLFGQLGVGLFNRGARPVQVTAHWSDLGIGGAYAVRDLWSHEDRGVAETFVAAEVASHGCEVYRLSPMAEEAAHLSGRR